MPLQSGSSRAAFESNLKTELAAGKPKSQALAIAYSKARGDASDCSAVLAECADALTTLSNRFGAMCDAEAKLARVRDREELLLGKSVRSDAAQYPHEIRIEITAWESLPQLIEFLRAVKTSAGGGHSFIIEADRADLGDECPKVHVDGDGNDHIGRIFLDGKDVTK